MKPTFAIQLFFLLIFLNRFSKAQLTEGGLYGVAVYDLYNDTMASLGLTSFDPLEGSSNYIYPLDSNANFGLGLSSIDPLNKRCFFLYGPHYYTNPHLVTVDLETGHVLYDSPIQSLGDTYFNIDKVFFNPLDSLLYTIYRNYDFSDSLRLVTVDPSNGILTPLFNLELGEMHLTANGFDIRKQILYAVKSEFTGEKYLVAIDLAHHTADTTLIKPTTDYVSYNLAFNCNDGMLYGNYSGIYPNDGITEAIVKINPENGLVSVLLSSIGVDFESVAINPHENKLYSYKLDLVNGKGQFCTYDINLNTLTCSYYTGTARPNGLFFDIYYPQLLPVADFTSENFCFRGITHFTGAGAGYEWQWNFDDPSSGVLNMSDEANPDHQFTMPGTYQVQLIVSNCLGTDTTVRQIIIEDFPLIDLGNDTMICWNLSDTIQFHLSSDGGYQYWWSDGGNDTSLEVSAPGTYWVNVTGSCGTVSDSITIGLLPCACDIKIFPDLTSNSAQVTFECDLKNYQDVRLNIYNMLGQIVGNFKVNEENTLFSLDRFSAGMYIVRLSGTSGVIATQKVVVVK